MSPDTSAGAFKLNGAIRDPPFHVAVTLALELLLIVPALAVNAAAVDPAATVTVFGTVRIVLLLDIEAVMPPAGAAIFRPKEQVALVPEFRIGGTHVNEDRIGTATTAGEDADALKKIAVASVPIGLLTPTAVEVAPGASVICTFATTPGPIVFVFNPERRHVYTPDAPAQGAVLPADTAAGPVVTEIAETWLGA